MAQNKSEASDAYRFTLTPYFKITDDLTGFARFGFRDNPEDGSRAYDFRPGVYYRVKPWLELWTALNIIYTENKDSANMLELRPFIGPKLYLPNDWKWIIYNYDRYEHRDALNLSTHQWSTENRIRFRFGMEIPLTTRERAWEANTWYAISYVEPMFTFDGDQINPLRISGGFGYVIKKSLQVEFTYIGEFTRSNFGPLEYTENAFRLNINIGRPKKPVSWETHSEDPGL